jgi:hypothetical protein
MKPYRLFFAALALIAALGETAIAQAAPAQSGGDDKGFTSYVEFGGTSNSDGQDQTVSGGVEGIRSSEAPRPTRRDRASHETSTAKGSGGGGFRSEAQHI